MGGGTLGEVAGDDVEGTLGGGTFGVVGLLVLLLLLVGTAGGGPLGT